MGPFGLRGVPAGGPLAFTGLIWEFAFLLSLRSSASVGNTALPARPEMIAGRYENLLIWSSLLAGERGFGPVGFGPTPRPLAAIHASRSRLFVAPAKTGYDAVGMRPISSNACAFRARRRSSRSSPCPERPRLPRFLGFFFLGGLLAAR